MSDIRVVPGHPRLWIAPAGLQAFLWRSRKEGLSCRRRLLANLDAFLDSAGTRAAFSSRVTAPAGWDVQGLALALGLAWRMTRDARYSAAARWLLEDLELWEDNNHNYDSWGCTAEAAACLYDWFHDHWSAAGRDGEVAEFTALCGHRAADDLLHRYILDDWHNYSLGLQAGILAAGVALGRDHPRIEDGSLLDTMAAWHFSGYRDTSVRMQDCHAQPPAQRSLDAGLRLDDGAGFACLQEATGAYHAIDTWEIVKMAEFWTHGTTASAETGGCVWPELSLAAEAVMQSFRPDGRTAPLGDGGPHGLWGMPLRVFRVLNSRRPDPAVAWFVRRYGGRVAERLPVFALLYGTPESAHPRPPALSAHVGPLACMRSGWGSGAVMVTFRCGRHGGWHNHLDHNSFSVFCGGPLAVDSGGGHYDTPHRPNYGSRTIAHNAILVRDPAEKSWPGRYGEAVANDGGQRLVTLSHNPPNKSTGGPHAPLSADRMASFRDEYLMGSMLAFESRGEFDYAAGDATSAYTYPWSGLGDNPSRRVEEAVRQVIFIRPGLIVIFDRVEATRSSYPKTWLLHSIGRPSWKTAGRRRVPKPGINVCPASGPFEIEHGKGRLTVWPLLPEKRKVRAVGGKGFEWWVEGAPDSDASGGRNYPPSHGGAETGEWRFEITPARPAARDLFLTVLHAGLRLHPRARDRFAFDVNSVAGETVLAVTGPWRRAKPVEIRFREEGPVTVRVTGCADAFFHSAPAPARISPARGK
ncbi:MAG: heparinase II/III family protein [Planctomycetes bacterium]|nr:heparinase II/III family protein [Planctomycetota bacterium]